MEKILSIIIPTYNMEKYLNKCLDSLIIDNMEYLEILVINDGSKDKSLSIAKSYEKKYPNTFKVIDKENGNYGSCINRGLKEATGKYVKILDADDCYDNYAFKRYIEMLIEEEADLIINDVRIVDNNNNKTGSISFNLNPNKPSTLQDLINNSDFKSICMHSVAYKRNILIGIHYKQTEKISYTDQEWIFLPMSYIKTIKYVKGELYCYLIGREGQTMEISNFKKNIDQLENVVFSLVENYENNINDCDEYGKKYLQYRVLNEIYLVFYTYIYYKMSDIKLKIFDKEIDKRSKEIFKLSESLKLNRYFHFIQFTRKVNYKINHPIIRINILFNKIINSIKSLK